jgi:hypothetical protein
MDATTPTTLMGQLVLPLLPAALATNAGVAPAVDSVGAASTRSHRSSDPAGDKHVRTERTGSGGGAPAATGSAAAGEVATGAHADTPETEPEAAAAVEQSQTHARKHHFQPAING